MPERKVGRPPKDNVAISFKLDAELAKKIDFFSKNFGPSKTWIVEKALQEFFEKHKV